MAQTTTARTTAENSSHEDDWGDYEPRRGEITDIADIVSPRAFLSAFGYNVDGVRVPNVVGKILAGRAETEHLADMVRLFGGGSGYDTYEDARGVFDRNGYTQFRVYRVDYHPEYADKFRSFANGGYLFEYHYSRGEHERDAHDGKGYFIVDEHDALALLYDLLGDDEDYPEWTERTRTAAHEQWRVLAYTDAVLNTNRRQLFEQALWFPEGSPENDADSEQGGQ